MSFQETLLWSITSPKTSSHYATSSKQEYKMNVIQLNYDKASAIDFLQSIILSSFPRSCSISTIIAIFHQGYREEQDSTRIDWIFLGIRKSIVSIVLGLSLRCQSWFIWIMMRILSWRLMICITIIRRSMRLLIWICIGRKLIIWSRRVRHRWLGRWSRRRIGGIRSSHRCWIILIRISLYSRGIFRIKLSYDFLRIIMMIFEILYLNIHS